VNIIRFEEVLKLDPDIVATACPFCTSMFEDAAGTLSVKESVTISDIAELAADKLA
jgi:Fe-S oxidoreductase